MSEMLLDTYYLSWNNNRVMDNRITGSIKPKTAYVTIKPITLL